MPWNRDGRTRATGHEMGSTTCSKGMMHRGPRGHDSPQGASPEGRWARRGEHKPVATRGTPGPAAAPISILKRSGQDGGRNSHQNDVAKSAQQPPLRKASATNLLPYPLPSFLQNPPSFLQHPPPDFLLHPPSHEAQAQAGRGAHQGPQPATPRSSTSSRDRARAPPARPVTPTAAGHEDDPALVSRWSPDSSDSPRPSRLKRVKKALSFANLRLRARKSGVFQRQAGDRRANGPGPASGRMSGSSGGSSTANKGSANKGSRDKHD